MYTAIWFVIIRLIFRIARSPLRATTMSFIVPRSLITRTQSLAWPLIKLDSGSCWVSATSRVFKRFLHNNHLGPGSVLSNSSGHSNLTTTNYYESINSTIDLCFVSTRCIVCGFLITAERGGWSDIKVRHYASHQVALAGKIIAGLGNMRCSFILYST